MIQQESFRGKTGPLLENPCVSYDVDIVMCIDATGSMQGLIDTVKNNALHFQEDLNAKMAEKDKRVERLRVKLIGFRDYYADGPENAIINTRFMNLPEEKLLFERALASLQATGGGDPPEDGLEALAYAIRSDWTREGGRQRHVIVLWSDDATHPLGQGPKMGMPGYPKKMPKSFEELTALWENPAFINQNAKRLLIFAPAMEYWNSICSCWDRSIHYPSEAGKGLDNIDYDTALSCIALGCMA